MNKDQFIAKALSGTYRVLEDGTIFGKHGRPLTPILQKSGRNKVGLYVDGEYKTVLVHRVVAHAFLGPSNGLTVNHIDGNPLNNHISNLEYVTNTENQAHYWRTNPNPRPTRTKMSHDKARELRQLYATGLFSVPFLADKFGMRDRKHLRDILNNKAWVDPEYQRTISRPKAGAKKIRETANFVELSQQLLSTCP